MADQITDEFRGAMADWVQLKTQLTEARKDMKILNEREKQLKEFIKVFMKNQSLDLINLKKGAKVTLKTVVKKSSVSKDAVKKGLLAYFGGDEVKMEGAFQCILDNLDSEESDVVSLTGIGKKA